MSGGKPPSKTVEAQVRLEASFAEVVGLIEQAVLAPPKMSSALTQLHGEVAGSAFKDIYGLEFLGLPTPHTEATCTRACWSNCAAF